MDEKIGTGTIVVNADLGPAQKQIADFVKNAPALNLRGGAGGLGGGAGMAGLLAVGGLGAAGAIGVGRSMAGGGGGGGFNLIPPMSGRIDRARSWMGGLAERGASWTGLAGGAARLGEIGAGGLGRLLSVGGSAAGGLGFDKLAGRLDAAGNYFKDRVSISACKFADKAEIVTNKFKSAAGMLRGGDGAAGGGVAFFGVGGGAPGHGPGGPAASSAAGGQAFDRAAPAAARLSASLQDIQASSGRVMVGLMAVGSAATAPLALAIKQFADYGDGMAKMSMRTGISVETLSGLGYAAQTSGADIGAVETGTRAMQKALLGLAEDGTAATASFQRLGISEKDLQGKSVEEQLLAIGDGLRKVSSPSERAALAMKVFGRSGTALLPMFLEGKDGLRGLMAEAKNLGLVMDSQTAAAAVVLDDSFTRLWGSIRGLGLTVGGALAPAMSVLSRGFSVGAVAVKDFVRAYADLIPKIALVGAGVLAVGAVLGGFAATAYVVTTALGGLGAIAAMLGAVFSPVVIAVGAVIGAFALLADSAFGVFGGISEGFTAFLGGFRVGGLRIATWFNIAWQGIMKGWAWLSAGLGTGLDAFMQGWKTGLAWLKGAFGGIAKWIVDQVMGALSGIAAGLKATIETAAGAALTVGAISEETASSWVQGASALETRLNAVAEGQKKKAADYYDEIPPFVSPARNDDQQKKMDQINSDLAAAMKLDAGGVDSLDKLKEAMNGALGSAKDKMAALLAEVMGATNAAKEQLDKTGKNPAADLANKIAKPEKVFGSFSAREVAGLNTGMQREQAKANTFLMGIRDNTKKLAEQGMGLR